MADAILVLHFAIVSFITAGLPLIFVGAWRGWRWVRNLPFRVLHIAAIVFVAGESVIGMNCPLTVWEDALRGQASGAGFIERWVHSVMFYDLPPSVFTVVYVGFAGLVIGAWVFVPPARRNGTGRPAR